MVGLCPVSQAPVAKIIGTPPLSMMGSSATTWVATAEILPTEIRNTGHAYANAVARIGGAISPFVVSSDMDLRFVGSIMAAVSFVTCILSWHMPETQGKALGTAHSTSRLGDGSASIAPPSLEMGDKFPNKFKEII